jgi:hypothetical protein
MIASHIQILLGTAPMVWFETPFPFEQFTPLSSLNLLVAFRAT